MRYCVALDCWTTSKSGSKMSHFPTSPTRRARWIEKVARPGWTPHKYSTLCDKHFADDAWENPKVFGRRKLKRTAVPTIFHAPTIDISTTAKSKCSMRSILKVNLQNEAHGGSLKVDATCSTNTSPERSQISQHVTNMCDQTVDIVEIVNIPETVKIQTDTQRDEPPEMEKIRQLEIAHARIQLMERLLKRKDRVMKVMKTQHAKQRKVFERKIKSLQNGEDILPDQRTDLKYKNVPQKKERNSNIMNTNRITEIIIPDDKDTICRFCMNISEELIFVDVAEQILLPKVGNICLQKILTKLCIKINKSEFLPKGICSECLTVLEDFFIFIEKIQSNEEILVSVYSEELASPDAKPFILKEICEREPDSMIRSNDEDDHASNVIENDHAYGKKVDVIYDDIEDDDDDLVSTEFEQFKDFISSPKSCTQFKYLDLKPEANISTQPSPSSPQASTSQEYKNVDTAFGKYKVYNTSSDVVKIRVVDRKKPDKSMIRLNSLRKSSKGRMVLKKKILKQEVTEPEPICIKHCVFCTKKFSSEGLMILHYVDHVVRESEGYITHRPFCTYCGLLISNSEEDLEEHIKTKHENDDDLHCHECEIKFSTLSEVTAHEEKNHIEEYEDFEDTSQTNKCPICEEVHNSVDDLIKHSLTHISRRYTCMTCKKIFVCDAALNEHHKEHPQYKYKCPICKKLASGKRALEAHVGTHATTRNYECDLCGRRYKTKNHLFYHRSVHFKPDLICAHCAYSTPSSKDFNMHMRIHSDERPFQCTFKDCGKAFRTNSALSAHVKQHLNIKNFACDMCDYKTSRSVGLTIHKRKHTGERPFTCIFCMKTFNRKWSLTLHLRKLHFVTDDRADIQE